MSDITQPTQETSAISSGLSDPTGAPATAAQASTDPVRSNETSALSPESRPELNEGAGDIQDASPTGPNVTNVPKEEKLGKGEMLIESHPINEGVLNYKGTGLKGLIFSKKYFWFHDQPVEQKHLASYISGEKSKDLAHANAAHASVTGKGLLFFAKRAEDKHHPQGIMNLADMSDVAESSSNDFTLKLNGHKLLFQALTKAERDGWLVALETKMADAKSSRAGVLNSSGYKSALENFGKPATAVGAAGTTRSLSRPKKGSKSRERATKEPTAAAIKPTDSKAHHNIDTAPTSSSNVAGNDAAIATTGTPIDNATGTGTGTKTGTTTGATTGDKTAEHVAEAATGTAVGAAAVNEAKHHGSISDEEKNKRKSRSQSRGNKRSSIFGGLLGKKEENKEEKEERKEIKKEEKAEKNEIKKEEKAEKKEEKAEDKTILKNLKHEEKAEKKAEEEELKEEKAIEKDLKHGDPSPVGTGPLGTFDAAAVASRVVGAPVVPVDGEKTGIAAETAPAVTAREGAPKPNKRNSLFGGLFNKKDASSPTAAETAPIVPAKDDPSTVSSSAPQLDNPVTSPVAEGQSAPMGNTSEAVATPPTESAAPATTHTPTDKRRTSFFSNLGTKKERRTGGTSDTELTDGEGKRSTGGLGGLLRKASRAQPRSKADGPGITAADNSLRKDNAVATGPSTNGEKAAVDTHLTEGQAGSDNITNAAQQTPVEATA